MIEPSDVRPGLEPDSGRVPHPARDKFVFPGVFDAHGAAGAAGQHGGDGREARLVFVAVAAAQVRPNNPHPLGRQAQRRRQRRPVHMNAAGGLPHRQVELGRLVPGSQCGPGLQRGRGVGGDKEFVLQHQVRLGKAGFDASPLQRQDVPGGEVAFRVYRNGARKERLLRVRDVRQSLVIDLDELERLPHGVRVIRSQRRHLVPHEPHTGVQYGQVGAQFAGRNVERSDHRADARQRFGGGCIHGFDVRVGMRAAENPAVEHTGELEVGGIERLSRQLFSQVTADHAPPGHVQCHGQIRKAEP